MRRSALPRIKNVEIEPCTAFDRPITPLRLIVTVSAVLVVALGLPNRPANDSFNIRLGDDFWDIDFIASHYRRHAGANNDQNSEANDCSSHKYSPGSSRPS